MNYQKHEVPNEYLEKWQKTVNLLAKIFKVPAGLIMRVWPDQLEVLVASKSEENPYKPHDKLDLNTGIYCETVMKTRAQLIVPDATQDEEWKNNPAIDLNMTFYMGIPLIWPDNQIFGTICVLDSKTRSFSNNYQELMWEFKKSIESDFKLIEQNKELHFQIAERKQAEEALRESEARWRSLTETSPDHILTLDADLNIQFANFAAPGLTVSELIGTPLYQYIEGEEKQKEAKAILESVLHTGNQKSYETIYQSPDNGLIYYESQVSSRGSVGLTVSARNITKRKQMEDELRETRAILQAALDNSPVGIAIANAPDGKLRYVNNAGLSIPAGNKKDSIRDVDMENYASSWQIFHFDGTAYNIDEVPLARAIIYGESCSDEFIIRRESGEDRIVFASAAPILNDQGVVSHGIVVFHDITDRKAAEEQIKTALKEKETLLQEIHHRVKNNLTVVVSLLKLQANSIDDERLKAALADSQSRVLSMCNIHELLYKSDNLSALDMNAYLTKLTRDAAQNYTLGTKVTFNIKAELIFIGTKQASPVGLIVIELITNSFKYAFPDDKTGEINISLQKTENQVELEYSDNGIGMPDGLDWKNSKSLGLKLIKTIAESQLGGSIDMKSNNGAKFIIKFNIET